MIQRTYVFMDTVIPFVTDDGYIVEVYSHMIGKVIPLPANVTMDYAQGRVVLIIDTMTDYKEVGATTTFVTSQTTAYVQGMESTYLDTITMFNQDYNKTYTLDEIILFNKKYAELEEGSVQ